MFDRERYLSIDFHMFQCDWRSFFFVSSSLPSIQPCKMLVWQLPNIHLVRLYGISYMLYGSCGLNKNVDCKSIDDDVALSRCCQRKWISLCHGIQCFLSFEYLFISVAARSKNAFGFYLFVQNQFVIEFHLFNTRRIIVKSDKWCGERNFNSRCITLHIEHDQTIIHSFKKTRRSAAGSIVRASEVKLPLIWASINKWMRWYSSTHEHMSIFCCKRNKKRKEKNKRTKQKLCGSNVLEHISVMRVGLYYRWMSIFDNFSLALFSFVWWWCGMMWWHWEYDGKPN